MTICALATAPGGAIGIIRISGSKTLEILSRIFSKNILEAQPNTIHYGHIKDGVEIIDEVLVSVFRALCMIVLLGGSLMMISIDQHVMLKSRETAVAMLNRVVVDLGEDTNPEGGVFFIGRPADNPIFLKDQLWARSNEYAHYGDFWLGGNLTTQSYFGYLRDAGVLLTFNWDENTWNDIGNREEVKTMPVYPDDGYVQRLGNAMVVRLS